MITPAADKMPKMNSATIISTKVKPLRLQEIVEIFSIETAYMQIAPSRKERLRSTGIHLSSSGIVRGLFGRSYDRGQQYIG